MAHSSNGEDERFSFSKQEFDSPMRYYGAVLVLISGYLVRKHAETVLRETQKINARVVSTPSFVAVRMAA